MDSTPPRQPLHRRSTSRGRTIGNMTGHGYCRLETAQSLAKPGSKRVLAASDSDRAAICAALADPAAWPVLRLLWERTATPEDLVAVGGTPELLVALRSVRLITDPAAGAPAALAPRGRLVWAGLRGLE